MPDVHPGAREDGAGAVGIDDGEREGERDARLAFRDVGAEDRGVAAEIVGVGTGCLRRGGGTGGAAGAGVGAVRGTGTGGAAGRGAAAFAAGFDEDGYG